MHYLSRTAWCSTACSLASCRPNAGQSGAARLDAASQQRGLLQQSLVQRKQSCRLPQCPAGCALPRSWQCARQQQGEWLQRERKGKRMVGSCSGGMEVSSNFVPVLCLRCTAADAATVHGTPSLLQGLRHLQSLCHASLKGHEERCHCKAATEHVEPHQLLGLKRHTVTALHILCCLSLRRNSCCTPQP